MGSADVDLEKVYESTRFKKCEASLQLRKRDGTDMAPQRNGVPLRRGLLHLQYRHGHCVRVRASCRLEGFAKEAWTRRQ